MSDIRVIVVGSFNRKKAREVRAFLSGLPIEVRGLPDFPSVEPVNEDADSFIGNAAKKALGLARQLDMPVVADDSGLEVDALDGRPGVFSARYAGGRATDAERNRKLLREMAHLPPDRRTARFRCAVAFASPSEVLFTHEAACEGAISHEPRGRHGFGYDSVFVPRGYQNTFGELDPTVKSRTSHRGQAFRAFRAWLAGK